jgi:hypothetical protein
MTETPDEILRALVDPERVALARLPRARRRHGDVVGQT